MSTAEPPKPTYAPLPARAIGDKRLTAEDFRVLGAVAAHDRLGANGTGCYASPRRLANIASCHEKSVSRSLSNLASYGYIERHKSKWNGRTYVYRVIYSEFDASYFKSIGNKSATDAGTFQPAATALPAAIGNKPATKSPPIGNKDFGEAEGIQLDTKHNIFPEGVIHSPEGFNKSCETAPRAKSDETNVGAKLAMLERGYKARAFSKKEIKEEVLPWLEGLVSGDLDYSSPEYGRAFRLFEDLGGMVS